MTEFLIIEANIRYALVTKMNNKLAPLLKNSRSLHSISSYQKTSNYSLQLSKFTTDEPSYRKILKALK